MTSPNLGRDLEWRALGRGVRPDGSVGAATAAGAPFPDSGRSRDLPVVTHPAVNILTVNVVLSTLIFALAARIYVTPRLGRLDFRTVMVPILLLHAFRHLGLMFLAPGGVYPGVPSRFAVPAAYGDFLASVLALLALWAVSTGSRSARPLVWIFNIEGTLDLANAILLANLTDAAPFMGPAYWIPAFWVPALLVTHYLTFVVLLRRPAPR